MPHSTVRSTRLADVLRDLALEAPPNLTSGLNLQSLAEMLRPAHWATVSTQDADWSGCGQVYDLFSKSADDYLDNWFEGDLDQGAVWLRRTSSTTEASPYAPGSHDVLLDHALRRSEWKAAGVEAAPSAAWERSPRRALKPLLKRGVEIETSAASARSSDRARTRDGRDPQRWSHRRGKDRCSQRQPEAALYQADPVRRPRCRLSRHHGGWRCGYGTFRMNVALSELPSFTCKPAISWPITTPPVSSWRPALRPYGPGLRRCAARRAPEQPADHRDADPSTLDDTLAPPGAACRQLILPTMSHPNCPMAAPGTTTATRSPI